MSRTAVRATKHPMASPTYVCRGDTRTEVVRRFYERAPFPNYPPRDNLSWLRARAERSEFARLIDRAIPCDARVRRDRVWHRADELVPGACGIGW